ncbi:MAG: ABC transporter permease subunit, partial [Firmicutes bacterium]|nr:ABC transporter permease subunit [Bacillota bacterium]
GKALVVITTDGYKGSTLFGHLGASFFRLFTAFFLAIATAVPLGLLSGYNKKVRAAFDPIIEFYRPLPPLAYYTLLVLWLGIGNGSKITLLYLACFAPIYIACVAAVTKVPANYINAAATLGANKKQIFMKVIFPYCLPDMFTGIRTAMGVGYSTLVAAEMVAAVSGIGWMVLDASNWLRSDIIFAGIIVMGVTGILIDAILRFIERKVVPWKGKV